MPDQPAQGSTADYCSRWPGEPHRLVLSVRANALVSVSRCSLCGWIDFDDIREQARGLIAEGRRQATERFIAECDAHATDYRRRYRTGPPPPPGLVDERPRDLRSLHVAIGMELARNLARHRLLADGPWEAAEQSEVHDTHLDPATGHWVPTTPARQIPDDEPGCPACGTILNAKASRCDDQWHADNRLASGGVVEPSGPLTAEEATPDCVSLDDLADDGLFEMNALTFPTGELDSEQYQREVLGMWPPDPCDRTDLGGKWQARTEVLWSNRPLGHELTLFDAEQGEGGTR